MREAGTPLIGGVALGRGGTAMDGLPLYDRIGDLPEQPNIALIYTPAEGVRDAIAECAAARIPTIMAAAEYVPVHDALAAAALARAAGSWLIGPNTLGMFVPGRGLLGSIAPSFCKPGRLAVIVRSGTVALALARQLTLGRHRPAHRRACRRRQRDRPQPGRISASAGGRCRDGGRALLRRDRRRQGICLRRSRARLSQAGHRHGGRPPCAGAEADGTCRRADRQRARRCGGETRRARRRGLPDRQGSRGGGGPGCEIREPRREFRASAASGENCCRR